MSNLAPGSQSRPDEKRRRKIRRLPGSAGAILIVEKHCPATRSRSAVHSPLARRWPVGVTSIERSGYWCPHSTKNALRQKSLREISSYLWRWFITELIDWVLSTDPARASRRSPCPTAQLQPGESDSSPLEGQPDRLPTTMARVPALPTQAELPVAILLLRPAEKQSHIKHEPTSKQALTERSTPEKTSPYRLHPSREPGAERASGETRPPSAIIRTRA